LILAYNAQYGTRQVDIPNLSQPNLTNAMVLDWVKISEKSDY